jgi:tetrahydromethanopterin S-methyltransferase subunit F
LGRRAGIVLKNKRLKKGCFSQSIGGLGVVFAEAMEGI